MENITKIQASKLFQEFGIEGLPARVYRKEERPDENTLIRDFKGASAFMLRTSSATEERNLPRRVAASIQEAVVWINDLPTHLDTIIQPYAPVVYSVELVWYGREYVAELVPGIWETS